MNYGALLMIGIWFLLIGSWIGNLIQFTECDFESPYRCEAIHAVGLIPIASVVTVWSETDEEIEQSKKN